MIATAAGTAIMPPYISSGTIALDRWKRFAVLSSCAERQLSTGSELWDVLHRRLALMYSMDVPTVAVVPTAVEHLWLRTTKSALQCTYSS